MEQRKLDYARLTTEGRNPRSMHIDTMSTEDMMRCINEEDKLVPLAVEKEVPNIAKAVDAITAAFEKGGRLIYTGCGTSGRLGVLDASECPPTFGVSNDCVVGIIAGGKEALVTSSEGAEDMEVAGVSDVMAAGMTKKDALVGISAAGNAKYVAGALQAAKDMGAAAIGLTCNRECLMAQIVDILIVTDTGAEVLTGSTRLKAGTAHKLVLNMLSTFTMVKLGLVYDNYMINVKPVNVKLRQRCIRIISAITGVSSEMAEIALDNANGDIRTAIERISLVREEKDIF